MIMWFVLNDKWLQQKKVKQAADKLKIAVSAIEEVQKIADAM